MLDSRQLAAIMFTDIVGYTTLMQQDEKKAIQCRVKQREVFNVFTDKYNGEILQYFGDGTLSIFKSSVQAIECAIEMQAAFQKEPLIPVRIGIHVGEIVKSESDIIGEAVNVASGIESLAISGSILISDKVHDQIRNQNLIKVRFLDAFDLKNVDEAVPVFAIANTGLAIPNPKEIKKRQREELQKASTKAKHKNLFTNMILLSLLLVAVILFISSLSMSILTIFHWKTLLLYCHLTT